MTDIVKVHDIEWFSDVPRSIWKQTSVGVALLALVFGGFGTWAATAPLAAAVISQGSFVATGQNKIVQHFEGGIIKEIMVKEGDQVEIGQPLIRLDETAALARERQLFLRRVRLEAIAARLTSQVEGSDTFELPAIAEENRNDPDILSILEGQQLNFQAWRAKKKNEVILLEQNIEALRYRAEGYGKQHESTILQLKLLREELEGKNVLFKKGLIRKPEINAIERAIAEATGQVGRISAEISETLTQIAKGEQQISQVEDAYRENALEDLQSIQGELDAVREQSREAQNILQRVIISAPVAGTEVRLYYHTPGGVIESGKGIVEILPADVPLIIEAQVARTDIDSVKRGQKASIRLTALNRRTTPVLEGEVEYVSADALPSSETGQRHDVYMTRIYLPPAEIARVRGFSPTPGMPAEVLIQTAERTFFSYLTRPITDSMSRAFSER